MPIMSCPSQHSFVIRGPCSNNLPEDRSSLISCHVGRWSACQRNKWVAVAVALYHLTSEFMSRTQDLCLVPSLAVPTKAHKVESRLAGSIRMCSLKQQGAIIVAGLVQMSPLCPQGGILVCSLFQMCPLIQQGPILGCSLSPNVTTKPKRWDPSPNVATKPTRPIPAR